tara:strand:+ start:913 stop:1344 length:432 start_codon:yes stop_codon:yes gene_type:complete
MKKTQQGFTLIELMIVIAIIGILAAVALPAYQDYVSRSQASEALNLGGGLKIQVADVYSDIGTLTGITSGSKGLPAANTVKGKYTSGVQVTDGVITATVGGDASATVNGETIILSPTTGAGSLQWTCKKGTIEDKYLPSACRA